MSADSSIPVSPLLIAPPPPPTAPNAAQKKARGKRMSEKNLKLRKQYWPSVDDRQLWVRADKKRHVGFTTMPRTMPLIMMAMDSMTRKGQPVSVPYMALWCRVSDESIVKIDSHTALAYECGYSGLRAQSTWSARMNVLNELGFISSIAGASGPHSYVLVYNPYLVIKAAHKSGKLNAVLYNALYDRCVAISALDLDDDFNGEDDDQ